MFDLTDQVFGGFSALASAACWAVSAILFRQLSAQFSALALNFGKGLIAVAGIGGLLLIGDYQQASLNIWLWLGISGVLGIVIGDTLYFLTLSRLGARLTLLLSTLIPISAAAIATAVFNEYPPAWSWIGILLTLGGVTWVLWHHSIQQTRDPQWTAGLIIGCIFILTESTAIVLSKAAVIEIPAMQAAFIRQLVATISLTMLGLATMQLSAWTNPMRNRSDFFYLLIAALIGTVFGTYFSLLALKLTFTAVAAALNATSPIFALPLAVWWLKEKITRHDIAGTVVAVSGIVVYFTTTRSA